MILLVTLSKRANELARRLEKDLGASVVLSESIADAVARLHVGEFDAVAVDQWLAEQEPNEALFSRLGAAELIFINFAISNMERVVREIGAKLRRRRRQVAVARAEVELQFRNETNDTMTALLLSCGLALDIAGLPDGVNHHLHTVNQLVRDLSARLNKPYTATLVESSATSANASST